MPYHTTYCTNSGKICPGEFRVYAKSVFVQVWYLTILPGSFIAMATPIHYRNTVEIKNIEPGALWERIGDKMRLVDEDQFVEVEFELSEFANLS